MTEREGELKFTSMHALSCLFTVKERKLISNLAASKTWTIKDRCLLCVSWLDSPF